jgi:DTW domain-containing protein YfiP
MDTRTRFVFLMHPKEFKREKAATGRLTHLCLLRSEVHMGVSFDGHEHVQALLNDPANLCVLLHPGRKAINLSDIGAIQLPDSRFAALREDLQQRTLVVFLLDATWALGRKMLKLSRALQALPRIMFTPTAPSRFLIKHQPHTGCLSTLEATHELLVALDRAGLDHYTLPDQLLALFHRMQDIQLKCAADPARAGYRRSAYKAPAERKLFHGQSATRRARLFQAPD